MTDQEKQKLIKKLGAASNTKFDARYSVNNRQWFVGKIIEVLLAKGIVDADVEKLTNEIIAKAGVELKNRIKQGFSGGTLKVRWSAYDQVKSRTQIIYGMIAMHPEFLLAANADYFTFILERRFRSIQRMTFFVNPNEDRNVFAYPNASASPPEKMKVNKDGGPFWTGVRDGTLPFVLSQAGKSDPITAVEKLFTKNSKSDRNLFACDPVVTVLHVDGLRAAKDPGKLLKALVSVGDHYVKIDNPLGHFANNFDGQRLIAVTVGQVTPGSGVEIAVGKVGPILALIEPTLTPQNLLADTFIPFVGPFFMIVDGATQESFTIQSVNPPQNKIKATLTKSFKAGAKVYVRRTQVQAFVTLFNTLPFHVITDSRPDNALFESQGITVADLQVGDHLYVLNHPLYKIFYPTGVWGGEHSFVTDIDQRDTSDRKFRTTLKAAGHGLNDTLLGMCDDLLEKDNVVLGILQALTKTHLDYVKTNGRITTSKVKVEQRVESNVQMNVFEYNMPYTYTYTQRGGAKKSIAMSKGFVIKERVATQDTAFQVFNHDGTDSVTPPEPFLGITFIGAGAADRFTLSKWVTPFFNPFVPKLDAQPLFADDNKTPTVLTFADLLRSSPFLVSDDFSDFFVTRPRVDFGATYQKFLKDNGAI